MRPRERLEEGAVNPRSDAAPPANLPKVLGVDNVNLSLVFAAEDEAFLPAVLSEMTALVVERKRATSLVGRYRGKSPQLPYPNVWSCGRVI